MIRGKTVGCPFGLGVPFACKSAGGLVEPGVIAVSLMQEIDYDAPEEDQYNQIMENLDVLLLVEHKKRCPFADTIFDKKKSVDCKYDEDTSEISAGTTGLSGSPAYPHIMIGQSAKPQYGYGEPLEYMNNYTDDNNTNIYYGIYNLIG